MTQSPPTPYPIRYPTTIFFTRRIHKHLMNQNVKKSHTKGHCVKLACVKEGEQTRELVDCSSRTMDACQIPVVCFVCVLGLNFERGGRGWGLWRSGNRMNEYMKMMFKWTEEAFLHNHYIFFPNGIWNNGDHYVLIIENDYSINHNHPIQNNTRDNIKTLSALNTIISVITWTFYLLFLISSLSLILNEYNKAPISPQSRPMVPLINGHLY